MPLYCSIFLCNREISFYPLKPPPVLGFSVIAKPNYNCFSEVIPPISDGALILTQFQSLDSMRPEKHPRCKLKEALTLRVMQMLTVHLYDAENRCLLTFCSLGASQPHPALLHQLSEPMLLHITLTGQG